MRGAGRLWLAWTIVIFGAGMLPPSDYKGHPHWERVEWIPYTSMANNVLDNVANVALFAPFGGLAVRALRSPRWWTMALAVGAAAAASGTIEWYQVYCHNHFPSATDFVNNVAGAGAGAAWSHWRAVSRPATAP